MRKIITLFLTLGLLPFFIQAQTVFINEIMSSNDTTITDSQGESTDWIEFFNSSGSALDLSGYFLSDDSLDLTKWQFPSGSIPANGFLIVWASSLDTVFSGGELHSNFKLSSSGEPVLLTSPDSLSIIDQVNAVSLNPDISYIRQPDGNANWVFTAEPTPGGSNNSSSVFMGLLSVVEFSQPAGFYTDSFYLTLSTPEIGDTIYYTLNGSVPTHSSFQYTQPILIKSRIGEANGISTIRTTLPDSTTSFGFHNWSLPNGEVFKISTIRAKSYKAGYLSANPKTRSYLVDQNIFGKYNFPIISLATDSLNLFSDSSGIYVWGSSQYGADVNDWETCNYSQQGIEWERPVHFEIFDTLGNLYSSQDCGTRLHGHATRTKCIKSMKLYARSEYGPSKFDCKFFPHKEQNQFKRILLRNSGNDCEKSYFRDAFMSSIADEIGLENMAYTPSIVFINGEYWGIHNIRERFSEYYFEENYEIPEDSLDLLEKNSIVAVGDNMHYEAMTDFVENNNMADSANYDSVKTMMDVENYIDYYILELFINNSDWPQNNIRFWRKRTDSYKPNAPYGHDGRWRWIVYDTDFGFKGQASVSFNMINNCLNNTGWSARLMRNLLGVTNNSSLPGNEEFRNLFINRFSDLLNTSFRPEVTTHKIDSFRSIVIDEMYEHIDRWNQPLINTFNWHINKMNEFAYLREDYIRDHLMGWFGSGIISDTAWITLDVSNIA
ncbi:MAG: CotH kinase family protein, partial [Bacteroidota bacterium]|nr:CotH kinase family protein [Bacteroidota bacterium]